MPPSAQCWIRRVLYDSDMPRASHPQRVAHARRSSYFLMYRTLSAFVVLVTYCVARGDVRAFQA